MDMTKQRILELKVFAQHSNGLAPSQIDEKLGLEPGTAHDVMVEHWHQDKAARLRIAND